ncbi:MAG: hypothetical protein ACKO1F_17480, partial [Flammeovirgaceae bacterium]
MEGLAVTAQIFLDVGDLWSNSNFQRVAYATLFSKLLNKNHMEFVLSKYHLATDELSELGFVNKRIIFSTRTATSIMID